MVGMLTLDRRKVKSDIHMDFTFQLSWPWRQAALLDGGSPSTIAASPESASSPGRNSFGTWNFPRRRGQRSEVPLSPPPVRFLTRLDRLSPRLFDRKRNFRIFGRHSSFASISSPSLNPFNLESSTSRLIPIAVNVGPKQNERRDAKNAKIRLQEENTCQSLLAYLVLTRFIFLFHFPWRSWRLGVHLSHHGNLADSSARASGYPAPGV